jgi:hypothetical protein
MVTWVSRPCLGVDHGRDARATFPAWFAGPFDETGKTCFYAFMRTTVDLPDPLFKRVKVEAARRGMKLRDFIARSLEQALSGGFPEAKSRQVKLPLVKGDGKRKIDPTREELDASLWDSAG